MLIKKDVDKRLLILVIVLLVLFISSGIYFEVAYSRILGKYNSNQEIVNEITANGVLDTNKTVNLKENILQYKEYLDARYDQLSTVNKELKEEIESLQNELKLVKSQIDYQKAKEVGPTSQFMLFQKKVEEVSQLKKAIQELCEKIKPYNISDGNCRI
ncbi:hypothetical protein HYS31_02280 [Candidatus Woesearchaeota archaeon]|nr:hypothetical protein [Candidatus Woesearchaeota archaeon]